jgi:hypothetical protein
LKGACGRHGLLILDFDVRAAWGGMHRHPRPPTGGTEIH